MLREVSLAGLVRPGMTVAVGDGLGAPLGVLGELAAAAAQCDDVRLILGWLPKPLPALDLGVFADVRTFMPGWGLRQASDAGLISFSPVSLAGVPALLRGPWRADLLVTTLVRTERGLAFGTEVSWQRAAIAAGAKVAAVVSHRAPHADAGQPLDPGSVVLLAETDEPPAEIAPPVPGPAHQAIAERIVPLIPPGARVQVGPSPVATALLTQLRVPVAVDSGQLPDAVVDLADRGLLIGEPVAAYLAGSSRLHEWADGRPVLHPVEHTHDIGRLSASPLFAVNTAVEIDLDGQVNVEGTAASALGGIGGHPDYAAAAARSASGLSIIAMPGSHGGRPTLVSRLSRPVTTPSQDVEVVVTERGAADLRGLSRPERRAALTRLWEEER